MLNENIVFVASIRQLKFGSAPAGVMDAVGDDFSDFSDKNEEGKCFHLKIFHRIH